MGVTIRPSNNDVEVLSNLLQQNNILQETREEEHKHHLLVLKETHTSPKPFRHLP